MQQQEQTQQRLKWALFGHTLEFMGNLLALIVYQGQNYGGYHNCVHKSSIWHCVFYTESHFLKGRFK